MATWIDEKSCIGCNFCNIFCPWEALEVSPVTFTTQVYVEKCVSCFICLSLCPADAIRVPPCMVACPIHMDIPGYLSLCADGKFLEGYKLMRRTNALPAVLGRVCYHPCEDACRSGYVDEPIAICAVKRFIADQVDVDKLDVPRVEKLCKKIAIAGAGPAGLAAAHELVLLGYEVTIFEASPEPGGMLRYGIPEYRLPRDILEKDIGYIQRLGVEIQTNTPVGEKVQLDNLRRDFQAVFLATGAHQSLRLGIDGEDTPGVTTGVDLLRASNSGQKVDITGQVAVIGGGNVAVDAARVAIRLGAESVTILYRRTRAEMPAFAWEVSRAEEEGVKVNCSLAPRKILSRNGRVSGVSLQKVKTIELDETGRIKPVFATGEELVMDADTVVVAIGQKPSLPSLGLDLMIDPWTLTTNLPGVYAGGDLVTGPTMVVQAMAAGKKAARYIHRHLNGKLELAELVRRQTEKLSKEEYRKRLAVQNRYPIPEETPESRIKDFREVEQTYSRPEAQAEARRCVSRRVCSEYKEPQETVKRAA